MRPALLSVLLLLTPALAEATAARVSYAEGTVTRERDGAEPLKLAEGAQLEENDVVRTGKDGRVELTLSDDSLIRLAPDSHVKVDAVQPEESGNWKVRLRLVAGSLWAKVTKRQNGERSFEVSTERVVAGVRGTEFVVEAKPEGHSVMVVEGTVDVRDALSKDIANPVVKRLTSWMAVKVTQGDLAAAEATGAQGSPLMHEMLKTYRLFRGKADNVTRERHQERRVLHNESRRDRTLYGH